MYNTGLSENLGLDQDLPGGKANGTCAAALASSENGFFPEQPVPAGMFRIREGKQ